MILNAASRSGCLCSVELCLLEHNPIFQAARLVSSLEKGSSEVRDVRTTVA